MRKYYMKSYILIYIYIQQKDFEFKQLQSITFDFACETHASAVRCRRSSLSSSRMLRMSASRLCESMVEGRKMIWQHITTLKESRRYTRRHIIIMTSHVIFTVCIDKHLMVSYYIILGYLILAAYRIISGKPFRAVDCLLCCCFYLFFRQALASNPSIISTCWQDLYRSVSTYPIKSYRGW